MNKKIIYIGGSPCSGKSTIPYVLNDCADKEKAFDNWMQRDILFAYQVEKECRQRDITCIINDGSRTADTIYDIVKISLGLK